jgi:hypothetical protein
MKKEATLKYMGLKTKTFDEKRGNPKTHGAQNKHICHCRDLVLYQMG